MNQIVKVIAFILLITSTNSFAQTATKKEIFSKAGKITIIEHKPEGFSENNKYPLLIIAPDFQGADEDIISSIAAGSKRLGFYVVRFNFDLKNDKPSKNLTSEINYLIEVKKRYSSKPFIDKTKVNILAKGFGSRILMRTNLNSYKSIGLLNPLCDTKYPFNKLYGPFTKSKKTNYIAMNFKNGACKAKAVYSAMSKNNYSYIQIFKGTSKQLNKNTQSIMALATTDWLSTQL